MAGKTDATQVLLRLGQVNGSVTTVGFPFGPDHDDLHVLKNADYEALNDHSKRMHKWLHSLPAKHQPYWTHVMQVDHMWANHSEHPPVWVSCPGHPDLERAVAAHFSIQGHTVEVGEPA